MRASITISYCIDSPLTTAIAGLSALGISRGGWVIHQKLLADDHAVISHIPGYQPSGPVISAGEGGDPTKFTGQRSSSYINYFQGMANADIS